jgi:hypothetical protein
VLVLVAAAGAAALAAIRLPNALDWRSESPYRDSARDVVNYREGSGRGRLKQWRNSARLVAGAPLLGVGPGNWSVRYPAVAPPRDPSLSSEGTTANPWPSSDWVAVASERGLLAFAALATAFVLLFWRAHQLVWHARAPDARLRGGVLGAVLAAALTAGAFDAVLLLAAPSFLVWTAAGALAGAADEEPAGPTAAGLRWATPGSTGHPAAGARAGGSSRACSWSRCSRRPASARPTRWPCASRAPGAPARSPWPPGSPRATTASSSAPPRGRSRAAVRCGPGARGRGAPDGAGRPGAGAGAARLQPSAPRARAPDARRLTRAGRRVQDRRAAGPPGTGPGGPTA